MSLLIQDHNTTGLYPDEIPCCLIQHINTANKNLLNPYDAGEILSITRSINHFMHDMSKRVLGPVGKPICVHLWEYIGITPEPEDILTYERHRNN